MRTQGLKEKEVQDVRLVFTIKKVKVTIYFEQALNGFLLSDSLKDSTVCLEVTSGQHFTFNNLYQKFLCSFLFCSLDTALDSSHCGCCTLISLLLFHLIVFIYLHKKDNYQDVELNTVQ